MEEAKSGESKADFIHKYSIAQKEARKSLYWLRILNKSEMVPSQRLLPLLNETEEIIAVITTIIVKVKKIDLLNFTLHTSINGSCKKSLFFIRIRNCDRTHSILIPIHSR
ncbi:hypothetical protein NCWK1_2164 [Nostoc cycadae WK-1]|uniref:Four helix bundle protein n=1 Tax=Nostoc cycadae WK-1 TaxID=1861711 RepID=A0A2H6LGS6_9NOSO|nr:hypothetical protein NCWK1_2164 [Nostoc cycadae WK-1]